MTAAVRMSGIRKSFGDIEVLKGVDLEVHRGEVHALLGGNGAGKSTLMKILRGVHRPDAGAVEVDGVAVDLRSPTDATACGVGMVFQELSLVPSLTVAQNMHLGREHRTRGLLDDRRMRRESAEVLDRMGVELDPRAVVGDLPVGYRQLVEIAKALSHRARILVLDEPTASLPYSEVERLFALVERLAAQDIAVIYISHRMAEITRVADRMSVIRDGRRVLCDDVAAVSPERVAEAIVGREILQLAEAPTRVPVPADTPTVLSVRDLRAGSRVQDVSFDLARGEILGLAGLIGSGRTELAHCLFGVDRPDRGTMLLDGRSYRPGAPGDAIAAGVMLLPESRAQQGLVLEHTIGQNMLLPSLRRLGSGPLVDDERGRALCDDLVARLQIRGATGRIPVSRLSGGNQQKVALAKWLALRETGLIPRVLILDEPTAGVDIATKTDIMHLVRELADAGTGVVLISSELEELLAVADRVLVLRSGCVTADLARSDIPDEESLQLAIQGG
ncbi:sugar ABC transporter ATP-binding protein [Pseudonocardia sp. WMMC193]|uniref:sugar ABC transporter ATP-binding protein n=1 Tax=Pseudonocardia sp. WMMC193 TaxID=2911965 RepID=UPI001F403BF3|nr:sugar ABC transporter ATP-binding protein [Pseudonocardia sp. WMMC193]MCF7547916.1 sugar ABC transporter ATP-binding protein [Pseudonocardia sp. WMMC193]